jgi:hypothetical protein
VNHVDRWLRRRGLPPLAFMVPTAYAGTTCEPYHRALVAGLRRRPRPIGWTGLGVFSRPLGAGQARDRQACLGGHPIVLWDNFPVNDTVLSNTVHLGPPVGRDADLPGALGGYLLSPMTQAHASLVGLGTAAAYLTAPARYRLISGNNVHHRLLTFAVARHGDWAARQAAAPWTLSLTVDGRPVALDAAGAFVTPGGSGARLVATTPAGDATAVMVTAPSPLG